MQAKDDDRPEMLITRLMREDLPAFAAWLRTLTPMRVLRNIGMTIGWFALVMVGYEVQCLIGYLLVFIERIFFGTAVLDGD